jgi:hypothetical protein
LAWSSAMSGAASAIVSEISWATICFTVSGSSGRSSGGRFSSSACGSNSCGVITPSVIVVPS